MGYFRGMEDTPIFSNTCGILFNDKVIFGFVNGDKEISLSKISHAQFREKITIAFWLLIVLPLPLYAALDYMYNYNGLLRLAGYCLAGCVSSLAYYYAKKKYLIVIEMVNSSRFVIRVSEDNKKDASKFINNLNKAIEK